MLGGWPRPRLRKTRSARPQTGNYGSGESERRRGEQRLRGWGPRSRNPCSPPRLPSWHPRKRNETVFPLPFVCHFFGAPSIFLGHAWADGKGKLATCRHRADSGGETVKNIRRHSLDRFHASMIKQTNKQNRHRTSRVLLEKLLGAGCMGATRVEKSVLPWE